MKVCSLQPKLKLTLDSSERQIPSESSHPPMLYLDFLEAHESISHEKLILKLPELALNIKILDLIEDYLKNSLHVFKITQCSSTLKGPIHTAENKISVPYSRIQITSF